MLGLSNKEFINQLDLESTDPVVRRLLAIINDDSIRVELEEAGMDPVYCTFEYEWEHLHPADYIRKLKDDIEYYKRDIDDKDTEIYNLNKEINRLSTTSLVSFIADVQQTLETAKMEEGRARRIAEHEKKLREEAEHKFEFWEKLNYGGKGKA